jgi:hypothetical protein
LVRWDAAIWRSDAGLERVEAARQRADATRGRAKAARDHIDHIDERWEGRPSSEADQRIRVAAYGKADADERERLADRREADADERERVADWREADADERERVADWREADADKRERLADQRELFEDMRRANQQFRRATVAGDSFTPVSVNLGWQGASLRAQRAELADQMADQAEWFAAHMENAATRCDSERRIAVAGTEREIARIGRQTAARLRDLDTRYETGEHLPRFPGTAD